MRRILQPLSHQIHNSVRIFAIVIALIVTTVTIGIPVYAVEIDPYAQFTTETDSWTNWPKGPELWGTTACLIDSDTGSVLYGKGALAERYPASITKVMTAILVLERCNMEDIVTMTETGLADAYGDSSNVNPKLGEQFTVEQCLQMLLIKSANDIATQLAEYTAGSVEAFTQLMNEKALSLGCVSTHFNNASGLEDENHYTTAYDMCFIMREALKYDKFREIIAMPDVEIPATLFSDARYYDTHVYLRQQWNVYYYEPCIGGKTGYTDQAMSTLVCAAQADGRTLIGCVMGAPDTGTNAEDMVDLFNYGFTEFNGVDLSRGPDMFTDPSQVVATPEPGATQAPVQQTDPAQSTQTAVAASPAASAQAAVTATPSPDETEVPAAITTTDQKLENSKSGTAEKRSGPVKTIVYVILICILAVIILLLVLVQINITRRRKRSKRNRRR